MGVYRHQPGRIGGIRGRFFLFFVGVFVVSVGGLGLYDNWVGQQVQTAIEQGEPVPDYFVLSFLVHLVAIGLIIVAIDRYLVYRVVNPIKRMDAAMVKVVEQGDLTVRYPHQPIRDEIQHIGKKFNTLMDNLESSVGQIETVLQAQTRGDFTPEVSGQFCGVFARMQQHINHTQHQTRQVTQTLIAGLKDLAEADFSSEPPLPEAQGQWKDCLQHLAQTRQQLAESVRRLSNLAQRMAVSDFSRPTGLEVPGDLAQIRDGFNRANNDLREAFEEFEISLLGLSNYNLNARVEGQYQGSLAVMQSIINRSLFNVASMFAQIDYESHQNQNRSQSMRERNSLLNDATQKQAAAVEETAASTEEIQSTIQQSEDNVQKVLTLTQNLHQTVHEEGEVMDAALQSMHEIQDASRQVADITGMIDSIAFQTNLLALNAAVEAARAGEHGRGFAVVAGEVRTLSQKSADAARHINRLIEDTLKKVEEGSAHVTRAADSLKILIDGTDEVRSHTEDLATTAREQAQGIGQIAQAMADVDTGVQSNAQQVEANFQENEALAQTAETLIDVVGRFTFDVSTLHLGHALETGDFKFAAGRRAHLAWVTRMTYILHSEQLGEVDPDKAGAADQCELGQWLVKCQEELADLPEFQKLVAAHADFHHRLGRMLKALQQKQLAMLGDKAELLDEIAEASERTVEAIDALEARLVSQA
ncbi:MAG: methyl-accepting chemotaxis protein [Hydrogenovibrio sp.]|uniref:methyl-accepting chemotaxis protein n=1 Tax=Hydrogenovibrio sp. TaxID=2065821 RepID=UPI0028706EA6|nr:methyl-accepting chemotaxis protein [Hydrogenovibrio sp.]MDR9499318.1 methyl-accepting chemotaxis protein [Hydrogenovibrio sp.]